MPVYVPTLAYSILTHAESAAKINLKYRCGQRLHRVRARGNGPGSTELWSTSICTDCTRMPHMTPSSRPVAIP